MTELNLSPSLILSANIANKVAIITGGASGVGAQVVRLLSAYGAHPWFCDVDTLAGEALVESTPNSHFIYADVTDWEGMYEFFRDVHTVTRHIDLVFANAGYMQQSLVTSSSSPSSSSSSSPLAAPIYIDNTSPTTGALLPPAFSTFDTTLTSAIYAAKLALYFFRHNVTTPPSGSLVFTTSRSDGGGSGSGSSSLYPGLKPQQGVVDLMRSLSTLSPSQHRLSHFHVGSVAVAPGITTTTTPIPTPTTGVGMFTPTPTVSQHLPSQNIIDVQLASSVALALVVMASNPSVNGKSWVVTDGGRCAETVD